MEGPWLSWRRIRVCAGEGGGGGGGAGGVFRGSRPEVPLPVCYTHAAHGGSVSKRV